MPEKRAEGEDWMAESQIWNIVNRATKMGKIRKMSRGLYGGVVETQA
jgi:hypothetical protein